MNDKVTIFEVGPRDGLQNENRMISTANKIEFIDLLSKSGLKKIEVSSFVSPKSVPQLADAAEVFARITRHPHTQYAALVPNLRGCLAAIESVADEVAIFASASETFSQKNINCSISESLDRFAPVMNLAAENQLPVRGYVSCITDCPYEGAIEPQAVAALVADLLRLGCYEVSLGDTIGRGTPQSVNAVLDAVLEVAPVAALAGHFHDTDGRGLDNIRACLARGVRVFDASTGGLGGCPFAPGAPGNVATIDVVQMLEEEGFDTGLDIDGLRVASAFVRTMLP